MISRLIEKIQKTKAPICVGLDPMLSYIPAQVLDRAFEEKGQNPEGAAEAVWQFNKAIVDATWDLIPSVKPQIAMYEQFGIPGLAAYKETVDYCHEKGLIVIGDVKRGDIGSTSESYAIAHLGEIQVGEKLPDWKAAAELVKTISDNYKLPYYTITPTYSVCPEHGYLAGEQKVCPKCGKSCEIYSRITGYYRPVQNWNDGKTQEFEDRRTYDIQTDR